MKPILSFIRDTITGGILFLLPIVLIIMILKRAHEILSKIVTPIADLMPDIFLGLDGSRVLVIVIMVLLCFCSGLLFRSRWIKDRIGSLENGFLSFLPGYSLMKSVTSDAIGHDNSQNLSPVVVEDNGSSRIGFITEEKGDLCVVFFPEPLKSDSGEVLIMPKSSVRKIKAPTNKITLSMKQFGKGLIQYVD